MKSRRSKLKAHEHDKKKANTRFSVISYAALITIALVIGSGLMVYSADDWYIQDRSNLTLLTADNMKQGGEESIVITAADHEGAPLAKQEIVVKLETGEGAAKKITKLYEGKTDNEGVLTPEIELPEDYNGTGKLIVELENGEQITQYITILEKEELKGIDNKEVKILISTDKPLYQPLQTIHIRVLALYGEGQGVYEGEVTVEVDDPDGNKVFREVLETNEYGITGTDFTVSDQLPSGNYKILAKIGSKEVKKSVGVQRYVLPKFRITFEGLKSWYTVDEHITGTVRCMYMFGKPVKGDIAFEARTYYGVWATVFKDSGTLDDYGTYEFDIDPLEYAVGLPINKDNGYIELNATITDPADHTETKLKMVTIAREPIIISTIMDTNIKGVESTYYVLAQAPDGSAVEDALVDITLDDAQKFLTIDSYNPPRITDSKGLYEFNYEYDGQTKMEVVVTKGSISSEETFELVEKPGIKLVAENLFYSVGDEVEFEVFYTGSSYTNWVYYDVISQGFAVTTGAFQLTRGSGVRTGIFTMTLTPEMVGTSYVRVFKIEKDEDVVKDYLTLGVAPTSGLDVEISKNDEYYNPNQTVTLKLKVSEDGVGVVSALGVGIVDQSIYELSGRFGGFEDLYFALEETAQEPQYQILDYLYSSGSSMPLPATKEVDLREIDSGGSGVSYTQLSLKTNWNSELAEAEDVKEDYVNTYWTILIIVGAVGMLALIVVGIKHKPGAALAVFIMVIITIVISGFLYSWTSTLSTEEDLSQEGNGPFRGFGGGEGEGEAEAEGEQPMDGDGIWRDEADDKANEGPMPPVPPPGFVDDDNDGAVDVVEYQFPTDPNLPTNASDAPSREHEVSHTREYFPETWYWNPVLITDENGEAELELISPDSITTWEVTGIANTKDGKLGVGTEDLIVFQKFFIEPDLPVSVIRNDTFPLKIMVYNYDDIEHDIWVYLNEDEWFTTHSATTQMVTVQSDNVSKVEFTIQALEVGENDLSVSAYNGEVWDDLVKPLRVDPDGKLVDETINGKLTDDQTTELELELSLDRVPNSENAFIKLQGGMEAVLLDGAETFIHFVSGCGEQSMSTLNIDILAFDVVRSLGTATEEKMFEYETIVTQGIQHELQYLVDAQNGVGRGIVWFPYDDDVHPWLTSWGLITFQDAIIAGFNIEPEIITDMQNWLVSQQNSDGSFEFPERGLYEFTNPILKAKELSASAYITRALLYSGYSQTNTEITNAVSYLEDNIADHWNDPYTLAITLMVLEDANGDYTTRSDIAARIDELKIDDVANGTAYWASGTSMITDSDIMFEGGRYGDANYHTIETTGYALMALAAHGSHLATVEKAVKYLLENRQGLGGWFATQDTIVAFQALRAAGEINLEEVEVNIYVDNTLISTTTITQANKDITFLIDLRPYLAETTKLKLESVGKGSILYQVYCEEYIPWDIIGVDEPPELLLEVTYDSTNIKVDDQLEATVSLKYVGAASHIKMILIDLRAPVGFSFVEDDLVQLRDNDEISSYEINDRQAYLYIEDLQYGTEYTLIYHLLANDPIKGTIQGIRAFDMYNTDLDAEVEPVEIESHL